ncbi:MAG TPA: tRNA pseudouridine(38-40) synthase TruA [Thermodesulfovibrionales bacterium]|nr:tRNA pseudouridine(38-40) synthase TruA [Thermodesulfovibrionales bacterium]
MRKIKLTIQYDGSSYHGWQVQPQGTTIQGLLEEVIGEITGERPQVTGSGRTDAGVHALGQVASFDSGSVLANDVLRRALNALLPRDVRITAVEDAPADFHPRYDAARKRYFYLVANTGTVPVFIDRYVWWLRARLDVEQMREAAVFLRGEHDFSAFRGAGCAAKDPVREVYSLEVERFDRMESLFAGFPGPFVKISAEANGFLRHMVRNIVGTLAEVGRGRMRPEAVEEILLSGERRLAGPTAPARGLFLEEVSYTL